jgi:hypothetical protein
LREPTAGRAPPPGSACTGARHDVSRASGTSRNRSETRAPGTVTLPSAWSSKVTSATPLCYSKTDDPPTIGSDTVLFAGFTVSSVPGNGRSV